jgi:hypothetical protein
VWEQRGGRRRRRRCGFLVLAYMLKRLTACSWILQEKLIVAQLAKNIPDIYGTRKFNDEGTRTHHHWTLS